MFYKHWKKIFLAIAAFFWNGCSDNAASSEVKATCTFSGGACPEYGIDFARTQKITNLMTRPSVPFTGATRVPIITIAMMAYLATRTKAKPT